MGLRYSSAGSALLVGRSDGVDTNGGFTWDTDSWEPLVSGDTLIYQTLAVPIR